MKYYHIIIHLLLPTFRRCFLCTVTGPTVIDINGQVNSAKDRCGYTLMKTTSIPGIKVHVTFKERRRVDVSFLDSVILQLEDAGVKIYLKQGGKVMVSWRVGRVVLFLTPLKTGQ